MTRRNGRQDILTTTHGGGAAAATPRRPSPGSDLACLAEAVLDFGQTLDWQQVLISTVRRLRDAAGAAACDIYAFQDDVWVGLVSLSGETIDESFAGTRHAADEYRLRLPGDPGCDPAEIFDIRTAASVSETERHAWVADGYRSGLLLPLVVGGRKVGEAVLYSHERRHFDRLDLLTSLAQLASRAIANAATHRELESRNRRETLVNDACYAFSSSLEPEDIFLSIALRLCEAIDAPSCDVMLLNEAGELTSVVSVTNGRPDGWQGSSVPLADWSSTSLAVASRSPIAIASRDDPLLSEDERRSMESFGQLSCLTVPLVVKERVIGVVELLESRRERSFTPDEIATVESVARMAALAIDNARHHTEVKRLHLAALEALSSALNAKDPYTSGHAIRVAAYLALLGQKLGWTDERISHVQEAAYLHDIGKIGVSDRALLKAGPLNTEEWALMRQHPAISAEIVRPLFDDDLVAAVRHHHERFDGGGYPDGLAGEAIPLLARVMCVADCYDAMSYERPYRRAFTYAECRAELKACAGAQFDPEIVAAFVAVLEALDDKRRLAAAAARRAASLIDPAKHTLLGSRNDESRPEYGELVAVLRKIRDDSPPVQFLCSYARTGEGTVFVVDAEEDPAQRSHPGDPWSADDDGVQKVLSGAEADGCVLFADAWGVWISGIAPVLDKDGAVVAAVSADVPALETSGLTLGRDPAQAFSSLLQAAGVVRRGDLDRLSDGLTGLYNHTYLHEHLEEALVAARSDGRELSVLFVDVDGLQRYNDLAGHAAGDEALRAIARALEACTRRDDLVARYGDDEFVAVLVGVGLTSAGEVAERLRAELSASTDPLTPLTLSIGIASYPTDAGGKAELLERAEWGARAAKRLGRDRVVSLAALRSQTGPSDDL